MKDEIIKHLKELGSELEKSYGSKLILLEEKDFKSFSETLVKKLTIPDVIMPFVCVNCDIGLKEMDNGGLFCPDCLTKYKAN